MYPYVLHNETIQEASEKVLSPGQVGLLSGWGVFSTIRVCGGVLFAYERHWARMQRDAVRMGVPFPDDSESLKGRLLELVKANGVENATLRVVVVRNRGGIWEGPTDRDYDVIALLTKLKDWGAGVRLGVQPQARHAMSPFAGAKILSWALNLRFLEMAQARGYDEALLLNERGEISECTSANIFAAFGDQVATPPLSSGCLPGVTRDIIVHEIRPEGVGIVERTLMPADLEQADGVFITSTTRDLLPVAEIEGLTIRRDEKVLNALNAAFAEFSARYNAAHSQPATLA